MGDKKLGSIESDVSLQPTEILLLSGGRRYGKFQWEQKTSEGLVLGYNDIQSWQMSTVLVQWHLSIHISSDHMMAQEEQKLRRAHSVSSNDKSSSSNCKGYALRWWSHICTPRDKAGWARGLANNIFIISAGLWRWAYRHNLLQAFWDLGDVLVVYIYLKFPEMRRP